MDKSIRKNKLPWAFCLIFYVASQTAFGLDNTVVNFRKPKPVSVENYLFDKEKIVAGAKFSNIEINSKEMTRTSGIARTIVWDKTGDHFFLADANEECIRKIRFKDLVEVTRLPIVIRKKHDLRDWSNSYRPLGMSKAGLVFLQPVLKQLWVVDPESLEFIKLIPFNEMGAIEIMVQPNSNYAYVVTSEKYLLKIDLEKGKVVDRLIGFSEISPSARHKKNIKRIERHSDAPLIYWFQHTSPRISPDGKYILANHFYGVHRLKILKNDLEYEEISKKGYGSTGVFTADSRYFIVQGPFRISGAAAKLHPKNKKKFRGFYLMKTKDLSKPVMASFDSDLPGAVGIDETYKRVYTVNGDGVFMVFDMKGKKLAEYKYCFSWSVSGFVVHPAGKSALILNGDDLLKVELP